MRVPSISAKKRANKRLYERTSIGDILQRKNGNLVKLIKVDQNTNDGLFSWTVHDINSNHYIETEAWLLTIPQVRPISHYPGDDITIIVWQFAEVFYAKTLYMQDSIVYYTMSNDSIHKTSLECIFPNTLTFTQILNYKRTKK